MRWKYILDKKRNEAIVLFSVLLMIVMIGYMHKKNLSDMEETVTSIYEDRLVANEYIFELSRKTESKKWLMANNQDAAQELALLNHEIDILIDAYEKTDLTVEESKLWEKLKSELALADEFENQILHNLASKQRIQLEKHLDSQYERIHRDLVGLSHIQLKEGKSLVDNSKKILSSNNISSRLEIALMIIVLLIFLMINPTFRMKRIKNFHNSYN
ncbi:MCP four helix bundle domain-containing protein [Ekhidna sp. MALMAid0563]|uniref:Four helix bundle sensory module for signal transduction n=1 Tax=Ekhidna lutea TaxID=447679 RepID=A0A239LB96_EKHLU|nr:MCP four helix bundle domain-containing protein [Ekhidna lutea]SNT27575.1 Four helix bundle sensory module for signal transduction [Ekhidna lutea]